VRHCCIPGRYVAIELPVLCFRVIFCRPGKPSYCCSSHHHSRGGVFCCGQTWLSVSPSNNSPFFIFSFGLEGQIINLRQYMNWNDCQQGARIAIKRANWVIPSPMQLSPKSGFALSTHLRANWHGRAILDSMQVGIPIIN